MRFQFLRQSDMGRMDRAIRITVGSIAVILYLSGVVSGIGGIVFMILGILFALSSMANFCPIYFPLGYNSLHWFDQDKK